MEELKKLQEQLASAFGDRLVELQVAFGEVQIEVKPADLRDVMFELRDREEFRFEQMMDLCGVDYAAYGKGEWITEEASFRGFSRGVNAEDGVNFGRLGITGVYGVHNVRTNTGRRFASVVQLLSLTHNRRLRVKTYAEDDDFPVIDSITDIWNSANWFEREAFDLFGIIYEGHPDLRRILTDYGFVGHPFRKDFPLIGNVEVRYDPDRERVIYQPVTIKPRVLVPRVVRRDNRYEGLKPSGESTNG